MLKRVFVFIYGVFAYILFLFLCLYLICFIDNVFVPKTIDSGSRTSFSTSLIINIILIGIWGLQHSLMARQWFKDWWTKIIKPPVERSTYTIIAILLFFLLFYQWRPIPTIIWEVDNPVGVTVLKSLYYFGWLFMFYSTFLINHFDLFGLRHVYLYLRNKEYTPLEFKTPSLHKIIRHPIMFSLFIVFWATPTMTVGHLLFSVGMTTYTIIGTIFEEKDLINIYGKTYLNYQRKVPMFFPIPRKKQLIGIGNN